MQRVGVLIGVVLAALAAAAGASAHGDPTAHYLESDNLLTSYASPPDLSVELQLRGLIDAAAERGYPIKVSLIANEGDTGGEPLPLQATQAYVKTVSDELDQISPLRAPVLIVTPRSFGLGGKQPRRGTLEAITPAAARELVSGIDPPRVEDGTALAQTAMLAIRQLASAGGHPLPAKVPPATQNPTGILGGVQPSAGDSTSPGTIAAIVGGSVLLLGGLLVLVQRRVSRRGKLELEL